MAFLLLWTSIPNTFFRNITIERAHAHQTLKKIAANESSSGLVPTDRYTIISEIHPRDACKIISRMAQTLPLFTTTPPMKDAMKDAARANNVIPFFVDSFICLRGLPLGLPITAGRDMALNRDLVAQMGKQGHITANWTNVRAKTKMEVRIVLAIGYLETIAHYGFQGMPSLLVPTTAQPDSSTTRWAVSTSMVSAILFYYLEERNQMM
jgi:hypothetical protein